MATVVAPFAFASRIPAGVSRIARGEFELPA